MTKLAPRTLIHMQGESGTGKTHAARQLVVAHEASYPKQKIGIAHTLTDAQTLFEEGFDVVIFDPEGKPFEVEVRYFQHEHETNTYSTAFGNVKVEVDTSA